MFPSLAWEEASGVFPSLAWEEASGVFPSLAWEEASGVWISLALPCLALPLGLFLRMRPWQVEVEMSFEGWNVEVVLRLFVIFECVTVVL